jgi:protein-S-isoprenylcysteine O-methyltransferase Ste14
MGGLKTSLGKLAYGSLFTLLLPYLLWSAAARLDRSGWASWPVPVSGGAAIALGIVGLLLIMRSMLLLWTDGKGLPMNAYPTTQLVSRSTYRLFAHPIYVGFVLFIMGVAGWVQSPTGFWLIAPLCALAAIALVVGYEGPALRRRFGASKEAPLLGLPFHGSEQPDGLRALAAVAVSLGPWAFLYWAFSHLPTPAHAVDMRMAWEYGLAQPTWAVWAYSALYPVVVATPFLLRSLTLLRRWVLAAWVCTAVGFTLMLAFPNYASFVAQTHPPINTWLLEQNRMFDAEWMAAPSFHAAWTMLTALALANQWPALRYVLGVAGVMVGVSCVLTGSHAVVDVLLGALLGGVAWGHAAAWRRLLQVSERLGNSWSAVVIGPVRIISHSLWSFLAAMVGVLLVLWLAGSRGLVATSLFVACGLIGAGAWGYWLEGGGRLARPFGYYGFLFGSMCAMGVFAMIYPNDAGTIVAAYATGAPFAQAIGRLRCVVQGCCHGRPVLSAYGISISNPMSRVLSLADFRGKSIHPTPLYSIVANLVLGLLLYRLWQSNAPWTLIAGLYFALSSLARFAEEQYRGEPQTAMKAGLSIYQWLAAGLFVVGLVVLSLPGQDIAVAQWFEAKALVAAIGCGLLAAVLMSIDWPQSQRRFSRLTVVKTKR